jgi:hypothetical protein
MGAQAQSTFAALERLARDHHELDALWQEVDDGLASAETAAPSGLDCERVEHFVNAFLAHHGAEDQVIAPMAGLLLQNDDLAAIGDSMAARRGTTWAALGAR